MGRVECRAHVGIKACLLSRRGSVAVKLTQFSNSCYLDPGFLSTIKAAVLFLLSYILKISPSIYFYWSLS